MKLQTPQPPQEFNCAVAYHADGSIYDYIGNWETAQAMANDGYQVAALRGDGIMSRQQLQSMVDGELRAALDCFGEGHRK